jgi:hypothetical protein
MGEAGESPLGGKRLPNGDVADAGGSLSFDRYNANEVVKLIGVNDKSDDFAGLIISDSKENARGHRRIWVGKSDDGLASLALMDAKGNERIQLKVPADGTPEINFLDADGKVVRVIKGDAAASKQ